LPHPTNITNNLWDPSKSIIFAPSQHAGLRDRTWYPSTPIVFAESPFAKSYRDRRTFTSSAQTNGSSTPNLNVKSIETNKGKRTVAGVSRSRSKTLPIASFAPTERPRKAVIPKRPIRLDDNDEHAIGKFLEASKLKKEREEKERRQQEIRAKRAEQARLSQLQQEMRKEAKRLGKRRLAWLKRAEEMTLKAAKVAETNSQLRQEVSQARLAMLRARSARRIQFLESKVNRLRNEIVQTRIDTAGRNFFLPQKVKESHEEVIDMRNAVILVQSNVDKRRREFEEKRQREHYEAIEQERLWKETEVDWRMQLFLSFRKHEEIREVEDMEAEDERTWFEMKERRFQEEEKRRQTELREDYSQLKGVFEQWRAANHYFLSNLFKLISIYCNAHMEWDSMRTKADKSQREIVKDVATSQQFLQAARYTSLRTKLEQIEIDQKEIIDHIRLLADIAKYRMLFWLYHIERFKEEEHVLSMRSHFARRLRQLFSLKSDRTPIRLFADKLTSPFNHYMDSVKDLEKDFRSLFSWNPPSPSRTRVADLPFHMSRLKAKDPHQMLRQSQPKVLDIMMQSKALMLNAKSIKLTKNLEERLILSKLATRPLVEQYLYLYVDAPLRKFVNTTYAIDGEFVKFKNDMISLFIRRAGRLVPGNMERLIDHLTSYRWKFIQGTALFTVDVKNEVYDHFLRPNLQEQLEVRRDEIIKKRERRFEAVIEMQNYRSSLTKNLRNHERRTRQKSVVRTLESSPARNRKLKIRSVSTVKAGRIESIKPRRSLSASGRELKLRGSVGIVKLRWIESRECKEQNRQRKTTKSLKSYRRIPNLCKPPSRSSPKPVESNSSETVTHAKISDCELGTASKHENIRNDKPMNHVSAGSVKLSTAFSPNPTHKSAHIQVMSLSKRIDEEEEEQSKADMENETSNDEDHSPLVYQIPDDVLQQAIHKSTSSIAAYWSHELYRGPHGERVLVQYCRSKQLAENVAQQFATKKVLGFDIEWKPNAKSTDGIKANVSLIQLASEERIGLFHLALFKGNTAEEILPPTLREIIKSEDILKCGVAVKGDCSRLKTYLGMEAKGLIELSHIHNLVKFSTSDPKKVNKRLVGLAAQVHEHLQLPLYKGAVRTSDWSKLLNHAQSAYAAADAYASFRLFDALEAKRLSLYPVPQRPACVEYDQPIAFPVELTVDSDEETSSVELEDESEDTNQSSEMSGASSSVGSADISEDSDRAYHLDELQDVGTSWKSETTSTHMASNVRTASTPCNSNAQNYAGRIWALNANTFDQEPRTKQHQLLQAEAWVAEWKNNRLPNSSKPKVTSAALRAYALWHYQSLNVDSIASLMREPPLRKSTVSTYILECLLLERLPFRNARAKLLFNEIPWPIQWRYDNIKRKL
jgi:hypothetical protein